MSNSLGNAYDKFFKATDVKYQEYDDKPSCFAFEHWSGFHRFSRSSLQEDFYGLCMKNSVKKRRVLNAVYSNFNNIMMCYSYRPSGGNVVETYCYNSDVSDEFIIERLKDYKSILEKCPYSYKFTSFQNNIYKSVINILETVNCENLGSEDCIRSLIKFNGMLKTLSIRELEIYEEETLFICSRLAKRASDKNSEIYRIREQYRGDFDRLGARLHLECKEKEIVDFMKKKRLSLSDIDFENRYVIELVVTFFKDSPKAEQIRDKAGQLRMKYDMSK